MLPVALQLSMYIDRFGSTVTNSTLKYKGSFKSVLYGNVVTFFE